jgi:hypothetical protein
MALHTAGSTLAGLVVLEAESGDCTGSVRWVLDGKGDDAPHWKGGVGGMLRQVGKLLE